VTELRSRLVAVEETLRAIRNGEVDTVVVAGKKGRQIFTLEGAEHAYRVLIESMNEGALTMTADETILYANQCFARMVKCPLEQVTGDSFGRFLSAEDGVTFRSLFSLSPKAGTKLRVVLKAIDGTGIPVQISVRSVDGAGSVSGTIGVVVTDLSEADRSEQMLRALTQRVVQAQEAERGRVALELHDDITQLLCAIGFRTQSLIGKVSGVNLSLKKEVTQLGKMVGKAAAEVERITRNLRPGVLVQLGLGETVRSVATEFSERTGVAVTLACAELSERLPVDVELALYRIFQEALKNVEKHGRARHVSVELVREDAIIRLAVLDDGVGFDPNRQPRGREGRTGLGLLGMRERAAYVGGTLTIRSKRGAGAVVEVRIPVLAESETPLVLIE
jgi:two-component system NarL family sensor kinase